jgi:hypothetical protein
MLTKRFSKLEPSSIFISKWTIKYLYFRATLYLYHKNKYITNFVLLIINNIDLNLIIKNQKKSTCSHMCFSLHKLLFNLHNTHIINPQLTTSYKFMMRGFIHNSFIFNFLYTINIPTL